MSNGFKFLLKCGYQDSVSSSSLDSKEFVFCYNLNCCNRYNVIKPHSIARVRINVSGMIFETWLSDLDDHPTTLLGSPSLRQPFFDSRQNEYFFDRHRQAFEAIFQYYKYGDKIIRPANVPEDVFLRELEYFQLESDVIHEFQHDQGFVFDKIKLPTNPLFQKIWILLEYPETSGYAYATGIMSCFLTFLSITLFCVETIPKYSKICLDNTRYNFVNLFFICETICTLWFTLELIGRVISCPNIWEYAKDWKNIMDMVAIIPYYITLLNMLFSYHCIEGKKGGDSIAILRVIRLFRIFKLTKHCTGLQVLVLTFRASLRGLGIFLLAMVVSMFIFSSVIYYIEVDVKESDIASIPDAFWWCVITMSTVGYGDMVPKSLLGRIVGSVCAVSGVLTLAMAVPIISENFNKFYSHKTGRGRL